MQIWATGKAQGIAKQQKAETGNIQNDCSSTVQCKYFIFSYASSSAPHTCQSVTRDSFGIAQLGACGLVSFGRIYVLYLYNLYILYISGTCIFCPHLGQAAQEFMLHWCSNMVVHQLNKAMMIIMMIMIMFPRKDCKNIANVIMINIMICL